MATFIKALLFFCSTLSTNALCYLPPKLRGGTEVVLSSEDLAAASQPILNIFDSDLINAPADITFGVADIKYNKGVFKVVECGNGPPCSAAIHPAYINNKKYMQRTPYWNIFESTLEAYKLPIILIGPAPFDNFPHFANHPTCKSFKEEKKIPLLKQKNHTSVKPARIDKHNAIVIYKAPRRSEQKADSFYEFQQQHPEALLVNAYSNAHFFSKDATYKLFDAAGLNDYIPRYATYPKGYRKDLAKKILADLPLEDRLIIKPLAQTFALGVGLTTREHLDTYLKRMFGTGALSKDDSPSLNYWRTTKDKHFLVSEFARSQTIMHHNEIYEPTMRIVFLMTHEQGHVTVNIIGGYWKVPPAALSSATASLTDRYITNPNKLDFDGLILIEQDDLLSMKTAVAPVFAQLYKTILKIAGNTHVQH